MKLTIEEYIVLIQNHLVDQDDMYENEFWDHLIEIAMEAKSRAEEVRLQY